jgi:hypothetical protein
MDNITHASFEEAIRALIVADPKNNAKGNALKNWVKNAFNCDARVSHTTEDKALGNRVSEQFRHKAPIVVFVCKKDLNIDTLRSQIASHAYPELETVLIMTDQEPFEYIVVLEYKKNEFSNWAIKTLNVASEEMDSIELPENADHTLEKTIQDYITQYDDEKISDKDLADRYKKVYESAGQGRQGIETQLFGIKYTIQLKDKPQSGEKSIVYKALGKDEYGSMGDEMMRGVKIGIELRKHIGQFSLPKEVLSGEIKTISIDYINAIRTKPFLLLAGISGTGKSRIVREFAFKSCPKYLQDKEGATPGNYCMIEVKPNWHDSTELLGYYSNLSKSYQFKKFVKFLVKAKMFPDVPFFVCLDEMNLAPVEQYFAEFLSILETRKHPKKADGGVDMSTISTGVIIEPKYFRELSTMSSAINQQTGEAFDQKLTDRDIYLKLFSIDSESDINEDVGSRTDLTTIGLSLPDNVIIIGTVNMDDTTHQFSRKVIDRAMTIEMNGGKLEDMFGGSKDLDYIEDEEEQKKWQHSFSQRYVTADEVLETHPEQAEDIKRILPERLEAINRALKGTPFEVSYRVLNELTIMVGVMLDDKKNQMATIDETILENIINQAVNNILLMKILPRIEGDAEMFALSEDYKRRMGVQYNDRLEWLKALAPDLSAQAPAPTAEAEEAPTGDDVPAGEDGMNKDRNISEGNDMSSTSLEEGVSSEGNEEIKRDYGHDDHPLTAKEKIQEMIDRLNNQDFTRFWP